MSEAEKQALSVIAEVYKDLLSPSATIVGEVLESVTKTARLLFIPIDMLGAFSDRCKRYVKRVEDNVPEKNRIEAPAQIVGESLEAMKYLDEKSLLVEMFIKILSSSIDNGRNEKVHPAFPKLLSNLSRDEALMLLLLNKKGYHFEQYSKLVDDRAYSEAPQNIEFPKERLYVPDNMFGS